MGANEAQNQSRLTAFLISLMVTDSAPVWQIVGP